MNPHLTAICHAVIASALQRLDHTARSLEQKWGVGRLRLLVADDLRARFSQQLALLDSALASETALRDEILGQINGSERAWRALDAAASQVAKPVPATVWEAPNPDGGVFLIVRDNADASLVAIQAKERQASVYTLAEIGRLLSRYPEIAKIKDSFPGALVTQVRSYDRSAVLNDDLPF